MATLKIPTPLRGYTDSQVEIKVTAQTVGEAMLELVGRFPTLRPHLYNSDGKLRPFVNLFVEGHNINDLEGLATPIDADARVLLVPSIAGG
jgi:molybdopterin converting factor small subunit